MKLLVIDNLSSGFGDATIYDFCRSMSRSGDEVCLRYVDSNANFSNALADAGEFDAVVACGGDGTVSSVCYLLRGTGIPILPFPAGTANILTLNLLSPTEPHALATLVREGKTLDFDMGEIEVDNRCFGFSIMAGCGYDAKIMADAKSKKRLLGPFAYFQAAFSNPTPQYSRFTLNIDGRTVEREGVGVLLVNFSKVQFDLSFTERNSPRDGLLDVIVLTSPTALQLIPTVLAATVDHSGKPLRESDALEYFRGSEIAVTAEPDLGMQYDGEALEHTTPFVGRIIPACSRLIVSDEAHAVFSS